MANTLAQQGAQSATFVVPVVADPEGDYTGSLTVVDWAGLPSGKCKALLNKSYGTLASFFDDYATSGAMTVMVAIDGAVVAGRSAEWSLDGAGYPVLDNPTDAAAKWQARISVSYSASE